MLSTNEVVNKYAALSAWRDVCLIMVLVVVCLVEGQRQTVTDCVQLTAAVRDPKAAASCTGPGFVCVGHSTEPQLEGSWHFQFVDGCSASMSHVQVLSGATILPVI